MSATVKVFVPTYRRSHLLTRALRSLIAQTHSRWSAEVHNDDPADPEPAAIVAALGDPRIRCVTHERTLGATTVFNLVFDTRSEPFVALLEDDNWWYPEFLERMLAALAASPSMTIAWANQQIWEELPDGAWRDTGRLVHPVPADPAPMRFAFPHPLQCFGALHANGTVLVRTRPDRGFATPPMDLGGTEAVRERAFPHPLLYVPQPLGVFAATRSSSRTRDPLVWSTLQVLLSATFLRHAPLAPAELDALWREARAVRPRMTPTLLLATRQDPSLRRHAARATPEDWRHLALRAARRPLLFIRLLRSRRRQPELWRFLDTHTAARANEARAVASA